MSGFNSLESARRSASSCPGTMAVIGLSHSERVAAIGNAVFASESACEESEMTSSSASRSRSIPASSSMSSKVAPVGITRMTGNPGSIANYLVEPVDLVVCARTRSVPGDVDLY